MVYCHVTETNDLYNILGNFIRIACHGDRYSWTLFPNSKYPTQKINETKDWANGTEFESIPGELDSMLVRQLRNAFLHADCALTSDTIVLRNGQFVEIDGSKTQSIPLTWLEPKVHSALNIGRYVIDKTIESMRDYEKAKEFKGRFAADGSWIDMELIVDPKWGLVGIRSR